MSVALALLTAVLAMLIELAVGYPEPVVRTIGHPVTWMGRLIGALDRSLNRKSAAQAGGIVAVLVLLIVVSTIAILLQHALLTLPFGVAFIASASGRRA